MPPPSGPPSGYQPPAGPPPGYQPPPPTVPPPSGPPPAYGYPATYPTRSQSPGPAQYPAQPAYPSQAQYPGPPEYPGQPRYPLPLASVTGPGQLRSRALHRPSPRFGVTLAAAGVGLAVLGALIISIDQFTSGAAELFDGGDGGGNKTPGILICLVVVLLGYGLAAQGRTGPLGAAGVLATIIGLPALLGFIFFDVHNGEDPFNLTGVLALTVVGFVLAYLLGPTRGHPAYLAGAAIAFWLFILNQVQSLTAAPASAISSQISGDPTEGPNLTGLGVASLIIGIVYLAGTAYFDHRGLQGTATAFVLAGIVAFTLGFDLLEDKFGQAGTGILIFLVGLLLAALGAAGGRRFTTWLGGLWVLGGIVTLLEDLIHDATPAGITLIVIGLAVIVGAHFAAKYLREPLETDPGPSLLPGQVSEPVA